MPAGCTLIFEPFIASSVHVPLGLVPGNIYGQSTEAIDIGGGVCKRLLARPTFRDPDETGYIVAMVCHCPYGSVITAEPTGNERGDVGWQNTITTIEGGGGEFRVTGFFCFGFAFISLGFGMLYRRHRRMVWGFLLFVVSAVSFMAYDLIFRAM